MIDKLTIKDHSDGYKADPYIHTIEGRFYLNRPTWRPRAMAHSLSQLARYNGHAARFYSVAEHSVLVSLLMEDLGLGDPWEGLWHDGTESVMSDIPAPFKGLLPDWQAIDTRLEADMRRDFNMPERKTEGCKEADYLALFLEADQLIPGGGEDFYDPDGIRDKALKLRNQGWGVRCLPWKSAKHIFLQRHEELLVRRS